jgi:ribosomal-protein-alanine N-acetyltransferase
MFPDTLRTVRLDLRPIAPEDAGAIFDGYARDPRVTRFLTWCPHRSVAETDAYVAHCIATPPHIARTYVLVDRESRRVLGALDLRQASSHRVEFGYVLARAASGRGLMTEALIEVVRWALAQPSIFRIGAVCDVENVASARVMEKAGLVREGLLRRWLVSPNISAEPRDCFIYSRVRPLD